MMPVLWMNTGAGAMIEGAMMARKVSYRTYNDQRPERLR